MTSIPSGFGSVPFGVFGFGLSDPGSALEVSAINGPALEINPSTGDFHTDDSGDLVFCTQVQQRIFLALNTAHGSSTALPDLGNKIVNLRYLDEKTQSAAKAYVRDALKDLVREQLIQIKAIDVEVSNGRLSYELTYSDLTDGSISPSTFKGAI